MSEAENMGVSPSQVSSQTKSYSCPSQTKLENTHELTAEYNCGGYSEEKHKLESEIIQIEAGDSGTFDEDVTNNSFTDLDPPPEDARGATFDESSRPILTAIDQKLEPGARSVNTACTHGESSKATDSGNLQDEPGNINAASSSCIANETSQASLENLANNSCTEDVGPPHGDASKGNQIDKSSYPQQTIFGHTLELLSDRACCEPSEERQKPGSELSENDSTGIDTELYSGIAIKNSEPLTQLVTKSSPIKHAGLLPGDSIIIPANEQTRPTHDDEDKGPDNEHLETPSRVAIGITRRGRPSGKSASRLSRKIYMLRSLRSSDRVLRSRSQEKPKAPESSNNSGNVNSTGDKKGKRRKKRRGKNIVADEYSKIRAHLRYLLNRMSYEQSLITAYSGEGWKGLSLEKLKPEKELQRATSEITRRKVKIRDLFQHIDSLCSEGRFPSSLFDSEGQIDSEDIFCAKCGSKDLNADNDIILCDGACDRGFHQFCLIPPLLREDIPPDDEGWLCPGCDCKVDCIGLLNDSQGTNISISDSWEKVFPEAATTASGQKLDHNFGPSSDDSDDNDYDPDGPDIDKKSQKEESSSDESDFTSASDEFKAPPDGKEYSGLSSDDSEDDDYDPDAPVLEEKLKQESSSSDFTSDSEDLAATINGDGLSLEDECRMPIEPRGVSNGRKSKFDGKKMQSLNSELLSMLEPDLCQDESATVSGKRNVDRLDYKKLYDETYGNISTSSDDDYTDTVGPRKRRKNTGDVATVTANGDASVTENGMNSKNMNQELKENKRNPERGTCQNSSFQETNVSPAKSYVGASLSGSSGKSGRPSAYKKLGEAVTQRLYSYFKENQYPDRAAKASLAEELGITFEQVNKWFVNTRWSVNHSSSTGTSKAESASGKGSCDGQVRDSESKNRKSNKQKTNTLKSRR
ncbi:homeobox protein HAT3.1-like isoform X2 [Populus nigra]|uniref:homeobox protein HAT3.1-like isoform X2 n=1 Tax=Populus nigra TaxID=3691 RepID=UPI002B26C838|nr:homeobox protein HAT3.1-like isoform X2 [Populus nigra]